VKPPLLVELEPPLEKAPHGFVLMPKALLITEAVEVTIEGAMENEFPELSVNTPVVELYIPD
jgi:hypothetical protein